MLSLDPKVFFLLTFLGFMALVLIYVFYLKPKIKSYKDSIGELGVSEKQLQNKISELKASNKKLLSQNQLSKNTQNRYETKRKEDLLRSAYLLEGQETERNRVSREIHDGLGQMLTGIKLSLGRLKSPDMNPKFKKAFEHMNQLTNETIEASRAISFNLMPTALNDFGIASALKIFAKHAEKDTETQISIEIENPSNRYPQNLEINIYRIVQEAINNIMKHAEATKAKVALCENNGLLELSITDNGNGFDPKELRSRRETQIHNGLENIKTRVSLLNGSYKLTTLEGDGTDIFIKLPFEPVN